MAIKMRYGPNRREKRAALRAVSDKFFNLYNRFYNTATSIFSYKINGLDEYTQRLISNEIEHLLYNKGWATIFIDPSDNILKVGTPVGMGQIGQYRQWVKWNAVMANGYTVYGLNYKNAVILYNNKSTIPTGLLIEEEIKNMIETDVTIKQHIIALRAPVIFSGSEDEMLMFKELYNSIAGGEPVMFLDKGNNNLGAPEPFRVWNSDVTYVGDKLMMLYEAFENRVFTLLGIQSNRIDKKAQLGQTEVDKNDDVILINFESFKSEREYGVKRANEVFAGAFTIELEINEYLTLQRGETVEKGEVDNG